MSDHHTPSLLEPESRGGENAGRGFDFQDFFLASQIPCWLEWDGFASLLREGIGDIELKLYSPGNNESIELIEAKNYRLTPSVFWDEIDRFYKVDHGSPDTFRWFRLVAPEISDEIAPFQNSLRRIRSPYNFYPKNSGVVQNSFADFIHQCDKANKPPDYADFLFRRVLIDTGYTALQVHGEALFRQNFGKCLPEYQHVPYPLVSAIYHALLNLIAPYNTPITRTTIENTIRQCIPSNLLPSFRPVCLYTATQKDDTEQKKELVFDWIEFFGGSTRAYPEAKEWNIHVVGELNATKNFILNHRSTRHISVAGSRRLSTTLAIGSVFSATGGFTIAIEYRDGVWWHTNDHAGMEDDLPLHIKFPQKQSKHLIVSIGIPNDIQQSVEKYVQSQWNSSVPLLNVSYAYPVQNSQQANSIVAQIKKAIRQSLLITHATEIHLFCAIPSFIALLLGHRLNATAIIHCYEYVGTNTYIPTCKLNT